MMAVTARRMTTDSKDGWAVDMSATISTTTEAD
jgi:hypothetical protein